jgi:hypothetical protein
MSSERDPCERGEACHRHLANYTREELIEASDAAASEAFKGGFAEGQRDERVRIMEALLAKYEFAYDEDDDYHVDEPTYIFVREGTSVFLATIKGDSDDA